MIEITRPAPFFIADDRALDFLNSIASPWGKEIEWISEGHDLLAWLELAGLAPGAVVAQFRKEAGREEIDVIANQARELREWFRAFVGAHAGRPVDPSMLSELDKINQLLAEDCNYRQIETGSAPAQEVGVKRISLRWRKERRWRSVDTLLLPLAEAMGDFICRVNFEHVKTCEGPSCTLWFNDVSHNHTRRWCSMAVCGNRAKAAAHRARKRSNPTEARKTVIPSSPPKKD